MFIPPRSHCKQNEVAIEARWQREAVYGNKGEQPATAHHRVVPERFLYAFELLGLPLTDSPVWNNYGVLK